MINSNRKGKAGEREFRDVLRAAGFAAERGRQYKGSSDSPDVICPGLPIHFEIKIGDRIRLGDAYQQACVQCGNYTPAVAHRSTKRVGRETGQWMVTLRANDFIELVKKSL